jgi:hypothetical protein
MLAPKLLGHRLLTSFHLVHSPCTPNLTYSHMHLGAPTRDPVETFCFLHLLRICILGSALTEEQRRGRLWVSGLSSVLG